MAGLGEEIFNEEKTEEPKASEGAQYVEKAG